MPDDIPGHSTLVMLTSNGMGRGDPELQQKLLRTWITLLLENDTLPGALCFYTDAVKLVVEGSPFLDLLRALEEKGVRLIVCATCLKHFDLFESIAVGIVGGMSDIISAQWMARKVITL